MVSYKLIDDNGVVESMHFNETVVLREEFTTNSNITATVTSVISGAINQALRIPQDSDGNYANRVHIYCEEEGDFGVIIQLPVGTFDGQGFYPTNSSAITLNGGLFVGYNSSSLTTLRGVDMSKTSFAGYLSSGSMTNLPNPDQTGIVFSSNSFRTDKLACTIPLCVAPLMELADLDKVYMYFSNVGDRKINLIWTLEEDGGLLS